MQQWADCPAREALLGMVSFSVPVALLSLLLFLFGHMALTDRPDSGARALDALQGRADLTTANGDGSAHVRCADPVHLWLHRLQGHHPVLHSLPGTRPWTGGTWHFIFGYRPWELLQPVLGHPLITMALNVNYNLWFFVMNMFWVYYAFPQQAIGGTHALFRCLHADLVAGRTLAAIFSSSAGPCFYGRIGLSPDPYAPLMAYLNHVHDIYPLWALDTQNMLWDYRSAGSVFGGISAMPSMHNATTLLFVLTAWNKGIWLRNVLIAHMVLVFIASVHLGWHYAVDGYGAWLIALPLWWIAGRIAAWWE